MIVGYRTLEPVLFYSVRQRGGLEPQQTCRALRAGNPPIRSLKRAANIVLLNFDHFGFCVDMLSRLLPGLGWYRLKTGQILHRQIESKNLATGKNHSTLNDVLKLPNVSWPGVILEQSNLLVG